MRKIIYPLTFAMLFASSILTAGDMFTATPEEIQADVNSAADFININADDNLSYSFMVEAQMVLPSQGFSPGHTAYDSAPAAAFTQGSALTFNNNLGAGVSGFLIISDSDTELSMVMYTNYSTNPNSTNTTTAPDDSNLFLNGTGTEAGDATEFSSAALTNLFTNIHGFAACRAFALKNKSLAITAQVGPRVHYLKNNYHVRGTVAADDTFQGHIGQQQTTAVELYTAFCTSVLVSDTDTASVAIGADFHFAAGGQYNIGSYQNYTETAANVRTLLQDTSLPLITPSVYNSQEVSIIYISKPQEETDSAYRLSIGVGFDTYVNKDIVHSVAHGSPADISYFQSNIRLTVTI